MSPPSIRRNIQSPHREATSDGPKLGHVTRLRNPNGPESVRWTRRRNRNGDRPDSGGRSVRHTTLIIWSIVFSVMTAVVIVGVMVFWLGSQRSDQAVVEASVGPENVRIASEFVSPTEAEALALVKGALANRDPALVESYMRSGRVQPADVVEFLAGMEARDGRIVRTSWLSSMDVDGMLIEGVLVVCAGKTAPIERLALLIPNETGVWKMDFEAFARTSTPSWNDFLGGRAESARVRVFVAKDSYFNGPFSDESRWECFALAAPEARQWLPEGQELMRGYCRKESPQAKAMARIFAAGVRMKRATLEIRRMPDADQRQFEITRILAEEWALPVTAFDEKFN